MSAVERASKASSAEQVNGQASYLLLQSVFLVILVGWEKEGASGGMRIEERERGP